MVSFTECTKLQLTSSSNSQSKAVSLVACKQLISSNLLLSGFITMISKISPKRVMWSAGSGFHTNKDVENMLALLRPSS